MQITGGADFVLKTVAGADVIKVATEEGTAELEVVNEAAGSDTTVSVLEFMIVESIAVLWAEE